MVVIFFLFSSRKSFVLCSDEKKKFTLLVTLSVPNFPLAWPRKRIQNGQQMVFAPLYAKKQFCKGSICPERYLTFLYRTALTMKLRWNVVARTCDYGWKKCVLFLSFNFSAVRLPVSAKFTRGMFIDRLSRNVASHINENVIEVM